VVTCPCALSLATPAAITASTAALARGGLLVTRADALESLARATRVIVDKTGTLTLGHPVVVSCAPLGSLGREECIKAAAALEQSSSHPLAMAFRSVAGPLPEATGVSLHPGAGLEGVLDGRSIRFGSHEFAAAIAPPRELPDSGIYLAREGEWLARIEVRDPLRAGVAEVVRSLEALGLRVEVASGDEPGSVAAVAAAAGIVEHRARLKPEDKLARVRELQRRGESVLMVGDGVNDAPVLAAAQVSIAMGAGASLAQTSADAVLMVQDLRVVPAAIALARRTLAIMRQNLGWAVAYNFTALPLAALGLIPPWAAAIGMSASSLLVVFNAMRLRGGETARPSTTPGSAAVATA
jgi:Cu2+-exporting ATPase